MDTFLRIAQIVANIAFAAAAIFQVAASSRALSHLKREHPEVYVALGNPTAVSGRRDPNKMNFWNYVQSKEYLKLNDATFNALVRWYKIAFFAIGIAGVSFAIFNSLRGF
jgi:hypothetical protein